MADILFPPIAPYRTGTLPVDGMHTLYYEESGNPDGTPVIFLHGGPGGGISPVYARLFDPRAWRIITYDQRGSGRSTPYGETAANSPAHLVADLEHLRLHLGIERWHVSGGSWGSTLALLYATAHADRILSLTLRSIFLMRQSEIDWFLYGMRSIRPDAWAEFVEIIPDDRRDDLLNAYLELLENPDPSMHAEAARRWSHYETVCATLLPKEGISAGATSTTPKPVDSSLSMARFEAHYFARHKFMPDDFILQSVSRFRQIPAVIVQGQYDLICPYISAWELHQAWPEAELVTIPDAGHSIMEPGITAALIEAHERVKHIR